MPQKFKEMKNLLISSVPIILALVITAIICAVVNFEHVQGTEAFFWVFVMVLLPVVIVFALVSCTEWFEKYL